MTKKLKILLLFTLIILDLKSQENNKYLFKPSLIIKSDSSNLLLNDTISFQLLNDSLKRIQYTIDSTIRINKIKDSINNLKEKLAFLLECYFKSNNEDIPISKIHIKTIGDTILHKAYYFVLPFNLAQPYKPWMQEINLSNINLKILFNHKNEIIKLTSKSINIDIEYFKDHLILKNVHSILQNKFGNYYKIPVDSIFFDKNKKIIKIKKYINFYRLVNNSQKGEYLFTNMIVVKQFSYNPDDLLNKLQIINFSERWYTYEKQKITGIINYEISKTNYIYNLTRTTDPANQYADGKYTFIFDTLMNLKYVNYFNNYTSENWKKEIELYKEGYVHCYYDYLNDKIRQSLCFLYDNQKNRFEAITTIFEDDGISYFQRNNTTGKIRRRDRLTLEWGPWE